MPEENSITFETIRKIQIEEKSFNKLVKLPDNFYSNVESYLDQKRKLSDGRKDSELKNIERILEDVFDRRERKIVLYALTAARTRMPPDNLTEEENEFFDQVTHMIVRRREGIISGVFGRGEKRLVKVVFKEDVGEFVGGDMKTYGPFKANEAANIPRENFKILSERNVVEEVE